MWDPNQFAVVVNHVLIMVGVWKDNDVRILLANIYVPHDLRRKCDLWLVLGGKICDLGISNYCVCGDFNSIG